MIAVERATDVPTTAEDDPLTVWNRPYSTQALAGGTPTHAGDEGGTMTVETPTAPDGWTWTRTATDRIELSRDDGPSLVGERTDRDRPWRVLCRVGADDSTVVDALGEVPERVDVYAVLADAARRIEHEDLPETHLGRLLAIEDGVIRRREWRIQ